MLFMDDFGKRLQSERKRLGLKQEDMQAVAGVTRRTQTAYEAETSSPSVAYLRDLQGAGFDVAYILFGRTSIDSLSEEEAQLNSMFRQVDPERQRVVVATLRLMSPNMSRSGKQDGASATVHDPKTSFRGEEG